jgi:hypothetical protein
MGFYTSASHILETNVKLENLVLCDKTFAYFADHIHPKQMECTLATLFFCSWNGYILKVLRFNGTSM